MCILLFEISSLISREMSNIYYWEKLAFLKLWFSRKTNLKTCTSFEEQKVTRCIRENAYFGIISFNCLLSTNLCLRSLFIYFAWEIKDLSEHPFFFFNWDSLLARLNSHYEALSYKKRSTKNITGSRKSV